MKYTYHRGSRSSREIVEFDITKRGTYITTCVVDVDLLTCGIKAFPCGNGDDERLTPQQRVEILELVQEERRKLTEGVGLKTLESWRESGLGTFELYFQPGDEVTSDVVDELVNSVPPKLLRSTCTQAGEEFGIGLGDDEKWHSTYVTFHKSGGDTWIFDGYCFYGENKDRGHSPSALERQLKEARKEFENGH